MDFPLLTVPVRRKRDVVQASHRARQVGRLLGLDGREQAGLAAGVFEMTCRAAARLGRLEVEFLLVGQALRVRFCGLCRGDDDHPVALPAFPSLQVALPEPPPAAREDLAWVARELDAVGPVDAFEAMRQQNRELLQSLVDLRRAEGLLSGEGQGPDVSAAA